MPISKTKGVDKYQYALYIKTQIDSSIMFVPVKDLK